MPVLAQPIGGELGPRPDLSGRRLRVLVVDDNPEVAECLVMILRHFGHRAEASFSGRDCLARLNEFRPQVILLDISMPFEDGFEICRQIRRRRGYENIPIVACSAMDRWMIEEQSDGCRFNSVLEKPASANQIQTAVQRVSYA